MDDTKTQFHDDIGLLRRIDRVLTFIQIARLSFNAFDWYHGLNTWRQMLYQKMKPEDQAESEKFFNIGLKAVNSHIENYPTFPTVEIKTELYRLLDNYEKLLWKVYKYSGLMLKEEDDILTPESQW